MRAIPNLSIRYDIGMSLLNNIPKKNTTPRPPSMAAHPTTKARAAAAAIPPPTKSNANGTAIDPTNSQRKAETARRISRKVALAKSHTSAQPSGNHAAHVTESTFIPHLQSLA